MTATVNRLGQLQSETNYNYSLSGNKEIEERWIDDFLSERITNKDGKMIVYIMYHPTKVGSEWWCYRHEYY
jgi:hypothetical protein